MDKGVEVVDKKPQLEETEVAAEDGNLLAEFVDGDAHESQELKEESVDSEENEVFEEAMDDVDAQQQQHEPSDFSRTVANGDEEGEVTREENGNSSLVLESEKFEEATDAQISILNPEEEAQQHHHEPSDVSQAVANGDEEGEVTREENGNPSLVLESEKFEEATDAQISNLNPEEEAVLPKEKSAAFDVSDSVHEEEDVREVVLTETNETDGVAVKGEADVEKCFPVHVDGGVTNSEDGEQHLVKEESENGDFVSNDVCALVHVKSENGDSSEIILDDRDILLDSNGLFPQQDEIQQAQEAPHQVVMQRVQDVPAEKDTCVDEETAVLQRDGLMPLQVLADRDDGIQLDMCVSEVKERESNHSHGMAQMEEQQLQNGEVRTSSNGMSKMSEETVEDLGQSGPSDNKNSVMYALPALAAVSPPKSSSGPCLPSNGKSTVSVGLEKEKVTVEDFGELRSSDKEDSKMSPQPAVVAVSSPKSSSGPSLPVRPAGLGSSAPLLEPVPRSLQQPRANGSVSHRQSQPSDDPINSDAEENDETREKLQMIRVKFLRLAYRLGQTPHNVVVAQVLYRLGLAEQLRGSRNTNRAGAFSFDRASAMAEQLEAAGQEPLDFSCTILVIGKTGVGKSASINSIFDEVKFKTDAFQLGTKKVQEIEGTVQGIKVRVIDTPGLLSSSSDQRRNEKILHSVKRYIKKTPPDIVLYLDRLDMQSRDYGDAPLLHTITDIFGPSIWFNAIVVLTHAASAPPDGPNGTPLSYEMFVTQRSHVVQQAIRQAAGDVRLMNPVSLVENHSACRMNRAGQRVLPNGQVWKPQLLLLSFASKILAEANTLLNLQDSPPSKPFGARARVPPLPFLLSSLLQSRPQLKLPEEQFGDEDAMDEDLDEASDSGDESDYDELPAFKRLTKAQLSKLSKAQRKAYYEELDYREKLFFKKQLKEEKKRRKLLKKMAASAKDLPNDYSNENFEDESSGPASVPVPMPDLALPTSFDSDYPSHRYRFLDSSNPWLVRPVLETQGWDHDVGYEGLNVERLLVVKDKIPVSVSGQFTKDKKECTLQMEMASSIKHGEGKATSLGLDMQTVGKDMAYTLRGETRFKNFRCNNTVAGVSATLLGDAMSAGLKVEDKLIVSKRFRLLVTGGAMTGRGDVAYGGRFEATLRDKDYPIGRTLSTLALSVVDWHGDLAIGCNVQSQFPFGRGTNVVGHANWSNRGNGQVGVRVNSSEQLQIALVALVPIIRNVKRMLFGSSQSM